MALVLNDAFWPAHAFAEEKMQHADMSSDEVLPGNFGAGHEIASTVCQFAEQAVPRLLFARRREQWLTAVDLVLQTREKVRFVFGA